MQSNIILLNFREFIRLRRTKKKQVKTEKKQVKIKMAKISTTCAF